MVAESRDEALSVCGSGKELVVVIVCSSPSAANTCKVTVAASTSGLTRALIVSERC